MFDDTLCTLAWARVSDRRTEAARRAFLDAACRCGCARAWPIVAIGAAVVRLGAWIAGIEFVPARSFAGARGHRA